MLAMFGLEMDVARVLRLVVEGWRETNMVQAGG